MRFDSLYQFQFFGIGFIHLCLFSDLGNSSVQNLDIREDQLQVNRLNISCRINGTIHMNDIRVLEAAYHMNNGVYLTDICQKLVAKSLTFAGTLYQTCNIYKFNGSRCYFLCMIQLAQFYNSLIRNRYDANVRINCCKGIVCRQRSCLGQRIK